MLTIQTGYRRWNWKFTKYVDNQITILHTVHILILIKSKRHVRKRFEYVLRILSHRYEHKLVDNLHIYRLITLGVHWIL